MSRTHWSLGDVGCVGALLSVLAFQSLRHEPFESEKLSILLLCSVLMLARLLSTPRQTLRDWRTNPVILAVAAFALVTLVSSGLSLSPMRSFVGSGFRSYGWIVIGCQTLLVLYVATYGARLRALMPQLLMLIAVPLCLLAVYQAVTNPMLARPGSTTGNPNYLAAWLGLCLMWVLPGVFSPLKTRSRRGAWLLFGLWTLLVLITLNLTASRAAFIGLFIAGGAGVILWGALKRNMMPFIGLAAVALVMGGLLILLQARSGAQQGLARLLEPVDDFRQAAWADSLSIARTMTVPLVDIYDRPDLLAALRPLVGYGLDNLDILRSRTPHVLGVTAATTITDRMHSLLYDTLLSTGLAGLIAQLMIFEAVWLSLLARSHLLNSRRDVALCVALQGLSIVGTGLVGRVMGWTDGVSFVFALLGLVVGLLLWLAMITWRTRAAPAAPLSHELIGLWCASIFYFVCHLFGFQQLSGSIVFAALIGFCALRTDESVPAPQIDPLPLMLAVAAVFASSLLRSLAMPPFVVMMSVFIAGWAACMWLWSVPISWRKALLYGGNLAILLYVVQLIRVPLSLALNQTLLAAPHSSLSTMIWQASGYEWLTLLCYAYAGGLIWYAGSPRALPSSRSMRALVMIGLIGAGLVAVVSAAGHTLWNTASALKSVPEAQYAAEMAYEGAEQTLPWMLEARIEHLRFLRTPAGISLGLETGSYEDAIRTLDPYINNQASDS